MKKVFVNGAFDIVHHEHIALLKFAKELGSYLIVALDSDERIKTMKGDSRPINTLRNRIKFMEAIRYVDKVKSFDTDEELENIIKEYSPHIMVVGMEYKDKKVIGCEYAKELLFSPFIKTVSSTNILERMIKKPEIHSKGWGAEYWIVNNEKYCGKILHFKKDKRLSFHYHKIKDETFYVQSGKVKLLYGYGADIEKAKEIILNQGDIFHVPPGLIHQMIAIEETDLFEFSTQHLESDSYRIIKGD